MTRTIHVSVVLLAMLAACKPVFPPGGGGSGGRPIAWQLTDRGLTYRSTSTSGFKDPAGPSTAMATFALALAASTATVTRDGAAVGKYTMAPSGALSVTRPGDPPAPPELDMLAIYGEAPPAATQVGATWSRVDPSDADVAAHKDSLVIQSKRDYKVTKLNSDGTAEIEVNGSFRFVDTPGGRALVQKLIPNANKPGTGSGTGTLLDAMTVLTTWSPYLTGAASFDSTKGELARYTGTMVLDYNPALDPASIRSADARIEVTMERQ